MHWLGSCDIGAVIWTDLGSNFSQERGAPFSADAAIEYLKTLEGDERLAAADYIRTAPRQTDTPLRRRMRKELGW